jgi:hypothetical protein
VRVSFSEEGKQNTVHMISVTTHQQQQKTSESIVKSFQILEVKKFSLRILENQLVS